MISTTPEVVCLCGSTTFLDAFKQANRELTLQGRIVLSIGCDMRTDEVFDSYSTFELEVTKIALDVLHLRKIDLAGSVLVLNVGGYIGESTRREIEYAHSTGKEVRYLESVVPKEIRHGT